MGLGSFINKITGASNSASQAYGYSRNLAAQQFEYQKEAMQNSHQWEVGDLEKAGLNPVLSAGGNGANAGGVGGGGTISANPGATGLASMIGSAKEMMTLIPEIKKIMADTKLVEETTGKIPHEIEKIDSETKRNTAETGAVASKIMLNTAQALEARMNAKYRGYFPKSKSYSGKAGAFGIGGGGSYSSTEYQYIP